MNERDPRPQPTAQTSRPPSGEGTLLTIVSAAIFLYFGFVAPFIPPAEPPLLAYSVAAFTWMARIVGIGLLVVVLLDWLNSPHSALVNMVVALLAAAGCVVVGVVMMLYGYTSQGFLILLFGLLNSASARSAIINWRASQRDV